jgi:hypothetical protein
LEERKQAKKIGSAADIEGKHEALGVTNLGGDISCPKQEMSHMRPIKHDFTLVRLSWAHDLRNKCVLDSACSCAKDPIQKVKTHVKFILTNTLCRGKFEDTSRFIVLRMAEPVGIILLYRPIRMTPACTNFWTLMRMSGFLRCSCSAAGSSLACWRMLFMMGSCRMLTICMKS